MTEMRCVSCGCTDRHACTKHEAEPNVVWIRTDAARGLGLCAECVHMEKQWDIGAGQDPRPAWCPDASCRYVRSVQRLICCGRSHTHARICVRALRVGTSGQTHTLDDISRDDLDELSQMLDALREPPGAKEERCKSNP